MKVLFNPIALRQAKIVYNFGLSECSRVKKLSSFKGSSYWLSDLCFEMFGTRSYGEGCRSLQVIFII